MREGELFGLEWDDIDLPTMQKVAANRMNATLAPLLPQEAQG
jgi:hypothetical protein